MSYQALYRAYRPQTFDKVVGQEAVVKTLQNAIINNKITHAYLFCGPRGTGKTSIARIFAKALNCLHIQKNGEPCCECDVCKEISDSVSPDVVEIDAASNNGVDEIRDIRERVKFLPSGAKNKIYIIDEVHMLSTGAFNALLKILEEPPKHVIFILATTEPQKIPATIISRCQRFEFKPLNVTEISKNLKDICAMENVEISEEAVQLIGEVADGGMRDALSILDQTISYGNKEITVDDVNTITGSINGETMCNLMSYIDSKDTNNALNIINDLIKEGKEVSKIINGMLLYCRDLMLYKSVGPKDLNKYIYEKEKFQTLALKIANTKIIYFIELLCDIQNRIKYSNSPAIYLEIAVIRMSSINNEELDVIKRMDELETKIIDTNFSQENTGSNLDNEKVNTIENRLNHVIGELSKFELPNMSKKLNDIEQIVADKINQDMINSSKQTDASRITELQSEVSSKFVELEAKLNALENGKTISNNEDDNQAKVLTIGENINKEIDQIKKDINGLKYLTSNQNNSNDNSEIKDDIIELKNQLDLLKNNQNIELPNYDDKIKNLEAKLIDIQNQNLSNKETVIIEKKIDDESVETLKESYSELCTKIKALESEINESKDEPKEQEEFDNNLDLEKVNVLENKLKELEKTVYELMADKLASKDKEKLDKNKINKKPIGQTSIFEFGVNEIEEDNSDFGDLSINENENKSIDEIREEKEEISEETIQETTNENNNYEALISNNVVEEQKEEIKENSTNVLKDDLFDFNSTDTTKKDTDDEDKLIKEESTNIREGLFDDTPIENNTVESSEFANNIENFESNKTSEIEFNPNNNHDNILNEEKLEVKETVFNNEEQIKPELIKNEIINQYYDEENHVEVINKTNSSIVIRSEKIEEQKVEKEEQKEIIVLDEPEGFDKFAKYDIKDLEKLLYDAQDINAKNDKGRVLGIWSNLSRGADPNLLCVAELLQEAKVEAVGKLELVITYESVSKCNEVMRWSFKEQALRLLYNKLGGGYNYLALPLNIWKEKRREYIDQYQMGIKDVKLSPIDIKGLNVKELVDNKVDEKNEKIDQTLKMFGEDIVKIK